jgi:acyl carrier protein
MSAEAVTTDTITDRVRHIVVKVLDLTEAHIFDDQSLLHDDLAADSLDAVELMMEIEKEFEIDIADDDGPSDLQTIADIADFVRRVAEQQGVPLS